MQILSLIKGNGQDNKDEIEMNDEIKGLLVVHRVFLQKYMEHRVLLHS